MYKLKNMTVKTPINIQYHAKIFNENFEINFIKYFMHKYPTIAETIVPTVIDIQL